MPRLCVSPTFIHGADYFSLENPEGHKLERRVRYSCKTRVYGIPKEHESLFNIDK